MDWTDVDQILNEYTNRNPQAHTIVVELKAVFQQKWLDDLYLKCQRGPCCLCAEDIRRSLGRT